MSAARQIDAKWREGAGCVGKIAHATAAGAHKHRIHLLKRGKRTPHDMTLQVYRCANCHHWHIGNTWT